MDLMGIAKEIAGLVVELQVQGRTELAYCLDRCFDQIVDEAVREAQADRMQGAEVSGVEEEGL